MSWSRPRRAAAFFEYRSSLLEPGLAATCARALRSAARRHPARAGAPARAADRARARGAPDARRGELKTAGRAGGATGRGMCRNVRQLHNFDPPADEARGPRGSAPIRAQDQRLDAALAGQRGRLERAVEEVALATSRLLASLVTNAPAKNREAEAASAAGRARRRATPPEGGRAGTCRTDGRARRADPGRALRPPDADVSFATLQRDGGELPDASPRARSARLRVEPARAGAGERGRIHSTSTRRRSTSCSRAPSRWRSRAPSTSWGARSSRASNQACAASSSTPARSAWCYSRSEARASTPGATGAAWASWEEGGEGRPPHGGPAPADLPRSRAEARARPSAEQAHSPARAGALAGRDVISPSPLLKAFAAQVIGSTARPRRRRPSGSVSPLNSCRNGYPRSAHSSTVRPSGH